MDRRSPACAGSRSATRQAAARLSVVAGLIVVAALVIMAPAASDAEEPDLREATVRLRDGSEVKGVLLAVSEDAVRIDPEGPVSFRLIWGRDIASVHLGDGETILTYPWDEEDIPEELPSETGVARTSKAGLLAADPRGLRSFAVTAMGGLANTGGDEYYLGFGSGPLMQARVRYHFSESERRGSRFFLSYSYARSAPAPDDVRYPLGVDDLGRDVYMVMEELVVHHHVLEFGVTSRMIGADSYVYGLFGVGVLDNHLTVGGEVCSGASCEDLASFTIHDQQGVLRLAGGVVIGLTPRLGLNLSASADILYAGTRTDYYMQTYPDSNGMIMLIAAGLTFDL